MKSFIVATVLTLTAVTLFTACDKPDYQDPRHRSSQGK
jgi:hypothetical protein